MTQVSQQPTAAVAARTGEQFLEGLGRGGREIWLNGEKVANPLDHLARHGRWLGWGPTRHGIGGNMASYVRITEEELFVELFCDIERLEPDHEPRVYPDDRYSSNTWGPLPPRSYFRFDEAAIASERESLETRGVPLAPLVKEEVAP